MENLFFTGENLFSPLAYLAEIYNNYVIDELTGEMSIEKRKKAGF